jgi:hypothetical protein
LYEGKKEYEQLSRAVSPFRSLRIPPLKEMKIGDGDGGTWSLTKRRMPPMIRGYFGGLQVLDNTPNWTLMHGKKVWMSVTPMELESQAHHSMAASGRVLIGGAGIGVLAYNVARKHNVSEVVVVDNSFDVLNIFKTNLREWPESVRKKISVVNSDMLLFRDQQHFDLAAIDIWPNIGDQNLRPDMQKIAANLPGVCRFAAWGMELDFIDWADSKAIPPEQLSGKHYTLYAIDTRVPWMWSDDPAKANVMARMSLMAARQVELY